MDDSSDDDKPLGDRKVLNATARLLDTDSDNESPVPDWISQATPQKSVVNLDDSSDEEKESPVTKPSVSKETKDSSKPVSIKGGKPNGQTAPKGNNTGLKNAEAQLNSLSKKLPPAGGSQSLKPIAAIPDAAPGAEIPFVFPDKVQGTRYLVELEADSEGAGDLAGDAGAVGRFTLAGGDNLEKEMLLDLKGRIYNASLVECATTFCVVNLQPNEARVEAVLNRYVSLTEDERHNQNDEKHTFMYDDDEADAYQIGDDDKQSQKPGKRKAKEEPENAPKPKKRTATKPATAKRKPQKKPAGKAGAKAKKK